jgi:hypothetical protein
MIGCALAGELGQGGGIAGFCLLVFPADEVVRVVVGCETLRLCLLFDGPGSDGVG